MDQCLSPMGQTAKPTKRFGSVRIQKVENGYLINPDSYVECGTMIANTLPEALEMARKILD